VITLMILTFSALFPDQKGSNSVLQECLSCENVPVIDDLITANTDISGIKSHQVIQ
jgi:hypothetical protein